MLYFKCFILILLQSAFVVQAENTPEAAENELLGEWLIDLTPNNTTDKKTASMLINEISEDRFFGTFYRDGVQIQSGHLNTTNQVHGSLLSADNSGQYYSSFYLKGGQLYGSTLAVDKGFLSVWTASKKAAISAPVKHTDLPKFVAAPSLFELDQSISYRFGYLHVAENRAAVDGRVIKIPVYYFKSPNKQAAKDPLISLTGGPGLSNMRNAQWIKYWVYLQDRDLILFDQRGTQYSEPHLACPEWSLATHEALLADLMSKDKADTNAELSANSISALKTCQSRLESQGVNLSAYNTETIAADVEDLRIALGVREYNIHAISYGTKVAQVLMRDYPKHIRSVVLDSPLTLEADFDTESISNMVYVWQQIFKQCETDLDCAEAFPELEKRFIGLLHKLTDNPLPLVVKINQEDTQIYLKGRDLAGLFSSLSTAKMPLVPKIMNDLISGDYSLLAQHFSGLRAGSGNGTAMRLSVWCAEESPFVSRSALAKNDLNYPFIKGINSATVDPKVCDLWGVDVADDSANKSITSEIRTLIINGEFDHLTPTAWGLSLHRRLPNSYHLEFPGYHHTPTTYWDNPCAMKLANQFINKPDKQPIDNCYNQLGFEFVVNQ